MREHNELGSLAAGVAGGVHRHQAGGRRRVNDRRGTRLGAKRRRIVAQLAHGECELQAAGRQRVWHQEEGGAVGAARGNGGVGEVGLLRGELALGLPRAARAGRQRRKAPLVRQLPAQQRHATAGEGVVGAGVELPRNDGVDEGLRGRVGNERDGGGRDVHPRVAVAHAIAGQREHKCDVLRVFDGAAGQTRLWAVAQRGGQRRQLHAVRVKRGPGEDQVRGGQPGRR
mmetsp:Transcript_4770/g.12327  ORF Transcript_4770/g.12327 Transcript_4770/m.12327 type:complete len:228 (+) Transcript_4770:2062-2745(+)